MESIKCLGIIFGLEDIEANENETPFSIHFLARMQKLQQKFVLIAVQIWKQLLLQQMFSL